MNTATRHETFRQLRNWGAAIVAVLLIPGGLLLALLAWLHQRRHKGDTP